MSNRILVVGGDKSALEAAVNMRISNPNSEVKIIIPDDSFPYIGFGISDFLGMDIQDFEVFKGHLIDRYKSQFDIDILSNHDILSINAKEGKVTLSNQKAKLNFQLEYDKLILAQGGSVVCPLVEGRDLKNVFFEEHPQDVIDILNHIGDGKVRKVVVIGGSMKGIERAITLWDMDANVTLVEQEDHLLPGFDVEIGDRVFKNLMEKGIEVATGEKVLTLIGNPMGEVVEVHTQERILPCDLVIWITQREPNNNIVNETGLSLDGLGRIKVNQDLETNLPNIYAVGDCAVASHPCSAICNTQILEIFDIYVSKTGFSLDEAMNNGHNPQAILITDQDNPLYYEKPSKVTANFIFDSSNGRILGVQFLGETPLEKLIDLTSSFIFMGTPIEDIMRASRCTTSSRIMTKAGLEIISKLKVPM